MFVLEEEFIVGERTHCNSDLSQIVQVTDKWVFIEFNPMGNAITEHEGRNQMIHLSAFSTVGSELESVESSGVSQDVQILDVRIQIIKVIDVRGVLRGFPVRWANQKI